MGLNNFSPAIKAILTGLDLSSKDSVISVYAHPKVNDALSQQSDSILLLRGHNKPGFENYAPCNVIGAEGSVEGLTSLLQSLHLRQDFTKVYVGEHVAKNSTLRNFLDVLNIGSLIYFNNKPKISLCPNGFVQEQQLTHSAQKIDTVGEPYVFKKLYWRKP